MYKYFFYNSEQTRLNYARYVARNCNLEYPTTTSFKFNDELESRPVKNFISNEHIYGWSYHNNSLSINEMTMNSKGIFDWLLNLTEIGVLEVGMIQFTEKSEFYEQMNQYLIRIMQIISEKNHIQNQERIIVESP